MHPKELQYSPEHIWLRSEDGAFRLGLTDFILEQLRTIVYIELVPAGRTVKRGEPFGSLESSKTTSDLLSPLSGTITQVNTALADKPGLINKETYGQGWLVVIKPSRPEELKELLTAEAYLGQAQQQPGGGPC